LRLDKNLKSYDGIKCDQSFTLFNLGQVKRYLANSKELQEAKDYYERALGILNECKSNSSVMVYKVAILHNLGSFYTYNGDIDNAKNVLVLAKEIVDKYFPSHLMRIFIYEDNANLLYHMGMYNEAKKSLEECDQIRLAIPIYSKNHHRVGYAKSILGIVLCNMNYIYDGIVTLKQAEKIYKKNFKEDHCYFAFLYIYMSYAYEIHKEYDKALQYLIKAQKISKKHWGENSYLMFAHQLCPIDKFLNLDVSEKNVNYYIKALKITKKLFGSGHIRISCYHYLLGQIFENTKDKYKAKQHYEEALKIANNQHYNSEIFTKGNLENIKIIQKRLDKL